MQSISNEQLINELRCLRTHLSPVLNERSKEVLNEAERRLTGGEIVPRGNLLKKKHNKKDFLNHFLYK